MADASDNLVPPSASPIFPDLDIPCPHCEYNLRGLAEPRCPECGNPFDPHKVLHDFRETQPPVSILWVIRNVYSHPLGFWQLQQVRRSQGPRRMQMFFALLYVPWVLCLIGPILLEGRPGVWSLPDLLAAFTVAALPYAFFASLFTYLFVLIHGILCRAGLLRCTAREGVRAAKEIVGYGLVWFAPVLLGVIAIAGTFSRSRIGGTNSPYQEVAAVALGATAAACVAWAITLYQGARFVSGGSRAVAIWCTVANPFWYILILMLATAALR